MNKKWMATAMAVCGMLSLIACGVQENAGKTVQALAPNGVMLETSAFHEPVILSAETVGQANPTASALQKALPEAQEIVVYSLSAQQEGVPVQPNGLVKVTFPIPFQYRADKHEVAVFDVAEDGSRTRIASTLSGQKVLVELTHLGLCAVVLLPKAG